MSHDFDGWIVIRCRGKLKGIWSVLTSPNIFNLFTHQADIHPYETRSSQRGDYFLKRLRIDIQKRSFSRIGVKIWNSISCEVRQMSKSNFKNNVDDILLQRLLSLVCHVVKNLFIQCKLLFSCLFMLYCTSFKLFSTALTVF